MRPDHAEELFPILSDSALYEFTGGTPPASVAALADTIAFRATNDRWLNWVIRADGVAVGHAQATITDSCTYIAWVIGTQWQRRGYASEAARMLVGFLRERGETRACVHPRHVASQRVAANAGLRRTEMIEDGEEVWSAAAWPPLSTG